MKKPEEDVMIAKEKATWQAYKDKRADDFEKLVSPDLVGMNANGVTNLQDELETMSKSETKSFALNDMKVVMPDANTAIVICQAKLDGSFSGKRYFRRLQLRHHLADDERRVARRFPHDDKGGVEAVRVIESTAGATDSKPV
jgi:hypothetical protein